MADDLDILDGNEDPKKWATKELSANRHLMLHGLMDQAGADAMGLVTASPAANTFLGRLKAVVDAITGTVAVSGPLTNAQLTAAALATAAQIGEVQTVPTANTLLSRVKGTNDALSTTNSSLAAIQSAIAAQVSISTSVWTDNAGDFFILKVESDGTLVFTDPTGAPDTPGAGLRPAANEESLQVIDRSYIATNNGTGYSTNDILHRVVVVDINAPTPTAVTSTWVNVTTGAVIANPTGGHYSEMAPPLPVGAATESTLLTIDGHLDGVEGAIGATNTLLGATNETFPASDTASAGLNGRLQRIAQRLTSLIGSFPGALGIGGGLKIDGSGVPLPVVITDVAQGEYEFCPGNATTTLGATGAVGDYLAGVLIVPSSLSPTTVSIKDGSDSAIPIFEGGTDSLSNHASIYIPVGAKSRTGAWQIVVGATGVTALATGNFT